MTPSNLLRDEFTLVMLGQKAALLEQSLLLGLIGDRALPLATREAACRERLEETLSQIALLKSRLARAKFRDRAAKARQKT